MTEPAEFRDLFARAKAIATWEGVSGVKLFAAGKSRRGACPLCKAGEKKGAGGPFWVRGGSWGCFACKGEEAAGDIIVLEAELGHCTPLEAAARIVGVSATAWEPRRVAEPEAKSSRSIERSDSSGPAPWIGRLLDEARPILRTPAEAYLAARGIRGPLFAPALTSGRLLYHPSAPWRDMESGKVSRFPAMVALVETPGGFTGGIHVTYLARRSDGRWAKAPVHPAKRMHGPQIDSQGRPGGCWVVGDPDGCGPVVVGEGIETSAALALLFGEPCRVLAALSLGRLQGGWKLDAYGRLNPELVEADPERPLLTWPGVEEVIIAVDHDMKPVRFKRRKAGGGTFDDTLSATDRARICAGLAEQGWRRSGANRVRSMAPPVGRDFNDELMARVG